ncbi:MAG: HD domain-containing protein [Bacillota bacterium]
MRYLNELREGETVIEHYLCKTRQSMKSKNGKSYLSLKLQDKTGIVDAKVWDQTKQIQSFAEGDFIKIEAFVATFNNDLQLNIKRARKSEEGEYDPTDYIPATDKNIEEMYATLTGFIDTIKSPFIKELLKKIYFEHPEISTKVKTHSAAKAMHHNYLGGLLEHTLSVTQICDSMATQYPFADRDILICTAMLHDIAKIMELSDFPENDYTDAGQLLGHIYLCAELIGTTVSTIKDFPVALERLLKHSILAHHGEMEFGSPKVPETIEAHILHCADNLDAKIKMYEDMIKDGESTKSNWVGYNRMLSRYVRDSKY